MCCCEKKHIVANMMRFSVTRREWLVGFSVGALLQAVSVQPQESLSVRGLCTFRFSYAVLDTSH